MRHFCLLNQQASDSNNKIIYLSFFAITPYPASNTCVNARLGNYPTKELNKNLNKAGQNPLEIASKTYPLVLANILIIHTE